MANLAQEVNSETSVESLPVESILADRSWTPLQQRLLEVLQNPENRSKSALQICRLAGYKDHVAWQRALCDEHFVAAVEALGVTLRRRNSHLSHLEAILPAMGLLSTYQANRSLRAMKAMTEYMTTSPAWTGPRPPRFLIWQEGMSRPGLGGVLVDLH